MGLFKKIFKRKKGGTFVGNLLRKASNTASGGMLGNGADLAAWEAKQDAKAYRGTPIVPQTVANSRAVLPTKQDEVSFSDKAKKFFKENWIFVAVVGTVVLLGAFLFTRKKTKFSL